MDGRIHNENKGCTTYIPVEMLRSHAFGLVEDGCKPGPGTILIDEEEERLVSNLIEMALV